MPNSVTAYHIDTLLAHVQLDESLIRSWYTTSSWHDFKPNSDGRVASHLVDIILDIYPSFICPNLAK